jgi:hypothetical protein
MKFYKSLLLMVLSPVFGLLAQDKKPTLMILPSDNWCVQRYFISEYDNQGTKMKVPNYKQAFQEDTEIGQVISKIGSLMIDRGYPLKDAEQEIKAIESRNAEDNMTSSKTSGSSIAESPLDKLKNKTKADIILQIDSYTSKRIAASTGNGIPSSEITPIMLQNAIMAHIDQFSVQLVNHFTSMHQNGREIALTVKRFGSWDKDLETEIEGKEITDIVTEWLNTNTVNKQYSNAETSENILRFEQVKIPLLDANKNGIDARQFARNLQKYLKAAPLNIDSKLLNRGLGEAILILGEK